MEDFTCEEKEKIIGSLKQVVASSSFKTGKVWGETIEERGSQVTFRQGITCSTAVVSKK